MIEIYLDTYINNERIQTTGLSVNVFNGRLEIQLDDYCDYVSGYFRSVEDIEKVRDELQKYITAIKLEEDFHNQSRSNYEVKK